MRIAIIGAGGVGGYLAGRLIAAGVETALLARGRHLEAMRARGLTLREPEGVSVHRPAALSDDPAALGKADAVVVAVKGQDLAGLDLAPMVGPQTVVLPLLNGVEAHRRLDAALGAGRSLIGVARISATITAPGEVTRHSGWARFEIGEPDGARTPRLTALAEALTAGGAQVSIPEHPLRALWLKFLMLGPFSGVTALARCDAGTLRATPRLVALYRRLAQETAAVGRAEGAPLTDADVEQMVETLAGLPADMRASMAHDLAAGKPLEVDWLAGAVSRLGAARGLDTPANDAVWAALTPWTGGARPTA
jgi:2-dehydropantoate 2-reductase